MKIRCVSSSRSVSVGPRTSSTSQRPEYFAFNFDGTPCGCVCTSTRTSTPGLYCFATTRSLYRVSARRCPRPMTSRATRYDHSRSSASSAANVRISRGGSGIGEPRSIGRRISRPNARRNGVKPVDSVIEERYACRTVGSSGSQSYGRLSTARRSIETRVRLNRSHFPFACGRYGVVRVLSTPKVSQSSAKTADSNWTPRSECSCSGTPYRAIHSAYTARATVTAV